MSKLENHYWGQNRAYLRDFFGWQPLVLSSLNYFFSKMVKLEEKESPDPKLSDFE